MTKTKDIRELIEEKELWLRDCREQIGSQKTERLSWAYVMDIATILKDNFELKTLDLEGRKIDDGYNGMYGSGVLSDALEKNHTLKHLGLSNNNIDDIGAVALAEALRKNNSLEYLYLFDNEIGSGGAIALAQALKVNKTLKGLELSGNNKIRNIGALFLLEVLRESTSLRWIRLENKTLSSTTLDELNSINQNKRTERELG